MDFHLWNIHHLCSISYIMIRKKLGLVSCIMVAVWYTSVQVSDGFFFWNITNRMNSCNKDVFLWLWKNGLLVLLVGSRFPLVGPPAIPIVLSVTLLLLLTPHGCHNQMGIHLPLPVTLGVSPAKWCHMSNAWHCHFKDAAVAAPACFAPQASSVVDLPQLSAHSNYHASGMQWEKGGKDDPFCCPLSGNMINT